MLEVCQPRHDWFTATLTFGLCCGLIISYLPQHARIIRAGSSEGFSPWFLLLGSTSSAAGMLNMFNMQFGIIRCCRFFSFGGCLEMTAGVVQVGLQWLFFTLIFVLYILYYPPHLKYITPASDPEHPTSKHIKHAQRTEEWQSSVILAWVTFGHFAVIVIISLYLLLTSQPPPMQNQPLPQRLSSWATFLGVSSALLAAIQYAPQIIHTYRMKLVGALSIVMMMIQSPGAVLMVLSIALRPDTNWTSWITFAVAGVMQGTLLIMCICWKFRQLRLGIDDFGHPLPESPYHQSSHHHAHRRPSSSRPESDVSVPGLQVDEEEEPQAVRAALAAAIESAVEEDIVGSTMRRSAWPGGAVQATETTPLLGGNVAAAAEGMISSTVSVAEGAEEERGPGKNQAKSDTLQENDTIWKGWFGRGGK